MTARNRSIDRQYRELQDGLTRHFTDGGVLAVVKAPPGSGKTFTLVEVVASLVDAGQRVALAAQTNSQADDICTRIVDAHPEVRTVRFASKSSRPPAGFPGAVGWETDKTALGSSPGVVVSTSAKWSLTDLGEPFDLLAIDEAWQLSWADLMQCALLSTSFLMIGDPGQIPPVVTIDVKRWETSPRAPHEAAPEIVLADGGLDDVRFEGSLPACRRLPHEAVEFVHPFYDFDFVAYVAPGERGVDLPDGHRLGLLRDGRPVVVTIPTPDFGPPVEVDPEIAALVRRLVDDLLTSGATIRSGGDTRARVTPADIGVSSSHRVMNSALEAELADLGPDLRVDTPERWQGLERPLMIVVHPLAGVTDPSAFDIETGRLCVMTSRHQAGLVIVTRDHVGETLANFIPSAGQAPGRPDVVGRGHDAHIRFWEALESQGRVVPFN